MKQIFHAGWCPFCNQGWIEILKDTTENKLVLICNECDSLWQEPEDIKNQKASVWAEDRELDVATLEEIKEAGWDKSIVS